MGQQQLLAGWTAAAAQVLHALQPAVATGLCLFAAPAKSVQLCTLRVVIPVAMSQPASWGVVLPQRGLWAGYGLLLWWWWWLDRQTFNCLAC